MKDKNDVFRDMVNNIRVHGAILILGAGASYEMGMPLYAQFPAIIWRVLDQYPQIKEKMGFDVNSNAKTIIGDNVELIKDTFNYIESNPDADKYFKSLFFSINNAHKQKSSLVHENICKLVHDGYIKLVVSFNWDDLLETEWERLYGTGINDNHTNLIKPHGDVRDITTKWTYPNSAGQISDEQVDEINKVLAGVPRVFIVLGYSEQDEMIVKTLIQPKEMNCALYRISPSAIRDTGLPYKASDATTKLRDSLIQIEDKTWTRIDFSNQGGLENAILGHRLLPCDVSACPRLPMINDAKMHLDFSHFVVIEGAPGSGKSITAYQLAWDYSKQGWEVLKLNSYKNYKISNIELNNNGYKTVYIIDDAQQIDRDRILDLMSKSNSMSKLIITQTITREFPSETVTISQQRSVQTLYEFYKKNKKLILPLLKVLNEKAGRTIGTGALDTPLEFVLDVAKKENNIWLFNYSLRGGWQGVANECSVAREADRADILLTLIAIKQIFSLDKPVDKKWINSIIQRFGFNDQWMCKQIEYLYSKKLILSTEEIRTPHLQTAIRIIARFVNDAEKDELSLLQEILREEIISENNPILGTAWFFNMFFSFESKYKLYSGFFSDQFTDNLLKRCINQVDSKEMSHAGFVIDRVIHLEARKKFEDILKESSFLINWINNVNEDTAYSFSQIINSMINESKEVHAFFVDSLDFDKLIENFKQIDTDHLYEWAHFINRLSYNSKTRIVKELRRKLPKNEIRKAIQKGSEKDVCGINEMLCKLRYIDDEFVYEVYYNDFLPILKKSFNKDFCGTLRELSIDFLMYVLGQELFTMGKPNSKEKYARIEFVKIISSQMIQKAIFEGEPRDWDILCRFAGQIIKYDKKKFINAVKDEDYSVLNEKAKDLWSKQPLELAMLLEMLYIGNRKATEKWLFSNRSKITNMTVEVGQFSARTTKEVLQNGGSFSLTKSHRWECAARALSGLNKCDHDLCKTTVLSQLPEIKDKFYNICDCDWNDFYLFFGELLLVLPNLVDMLISDADVFLLEEKWLSDIKQKRYKHQRKDLKGLSKLANVLRLNTSNLKIIECMKKIDNEIHIAINNLASIKF